MKLIDDAVLYNYAKNSIPIGKITDVTITSSPCNDTSINFTAELDRINDKIFGPELIGSTALSIVPDNFSFGYYNPAIKKVIFNPPATIVLWKDGTKTVVKCKEGDQFDKWAGLSLCISKKIFGRKFHKVFKEWCDKEN